MLENSKTVAQIVYGVNITSLCNIMHVRNVPVRMRIPANALFRPDWFRIKNIEERCVCVHPHTNAARKQALSEPRDMENRVRVYTLQTEVYT